MADAIPLIGGATTLGPPGAGDTASGGTSVDTMVVGIAAADSSTAYAGGGTGLAASADSSDLAAGAAVATGKFLATASDRAGAIPANADATLTPGLGGDGMPLAAGADLFSVVAPSVAAGGDYGDPGPSMYRPAGPAAPATETSAISASTTQTVTLAGSGLVFFNTYTANVSASYKNAIISAENFYQSKITTAVTLNFTFDVMNDGANGFVAFNNFSLYNLSYSQLRSALASHATSPDDAAAIASLPLSNPTPSSTFYIPIGMAEALGLVGSTGFAADDDTTYLNSADTYFFNQSSPVAGAYDAVSAIEHEISEGGLGRIAGLGINTVTTGATSTPLWSTLDLFRYSSSGVRDFTGGTDGKNAFFSINGTTLLTQFHNPLTLGTNDGNDAGDWETFGTDSYGFAQTGKAIPVTTTDLRELDILGWNLAGPVVSSGQTLTVSSGQTSAGITVLGGGTLLVASGGTANGTIDKGTENVSGGTDVGATVSSGGTQFVYSGGKATGTTVTAAGTVNSAGQYVNSGGTASGAIIRDGGFQAVYGGTATGTTVSSGGGQYVAYGGTASGAVVRSGGVQDVFSAGTARGTTVSQGGFEFVSSGSLASGTTLNSGGQQTVFTGGVTSGGSVKAHGNQYISSGGAARGTVLSGGNEIISSGATATGTIVDSGGAESVYGTASAGTINSAGLQIVHAGGVAIGGTVKAHGNQNVLSGGAARSAVLSGGNQTISAGGTATATIVRSGGTEYVYGTAIGGTVSSGGTERVRGTAQGGTISSGGAQYVSAGGVASGAVVRAGGNQYVSSGGTTRATVLSGGTETVSSGGTASGTIVDSGGLQIVQSGGVASAGKINGGLVEVTSGGSIGGAGGTITFATGGTLQLDASISFAGTIAGFAVPDQLDLRDIAYTSGVTTESFKQSTGSSGVLTVTSGTHIAHLTLSGTYVTSQFHLTSDGHGGTLVTDPPVAGGSSQTTFSDIAPAGPLSVAADPAGASGTGEVYRGAGQTLVLTADPLGGDPYFVPSG